jgi:hypothetical protein
MELRIMIESDGSGESELRSLHDWLRAEDELTADVKWDTPPISETRMGAVSDSIIAIFGAGGAGVILARSITVWLKTRRPEVTVRVKSRTRTIQVEARNIKDGEEFIRQIKLLSQEE